MGMYKVVDVYKCQAQYLVCGSAPGTWAVSHVVKEMIEKSFLHPQLGFYGGVSLSAK